jgi:acid phosphatase
MTNWHVMLGDQDCQGDVDAQLAYSATSPRWSLPARHYTRTETWGDETISEFFYIDTGPYILEYLRRPAVRAQGQDKQRQIDRLERALASSKAAWKIVVGHNQLFTVTGQKEPGTGQKHDFSEMIGPFKPLFDRYGVRA